MRIESGYSLSSREERIELRSKRVQDFISLNTRSPQLISQGLLDVLHPKPIVQKLEGGKGVKITLDIEKMEDAALGILYCVQANLMHRSISPVPQGLHHMVDALVPREKPVIEINPRPTIESKIDLAIAPILEKLQLEFIPTQTDNRLSEYIYFSDPRESAIFAVAHTLVRGVKTDKKGRRVVFMEPKTKEWNQTVDLIRMVNKYLPERNQLIILPSSEDVNDPKPPKRVIQKKEVNKLVHIPKKEMGTYRNIKDILHMAQEYVDIQVHNDSEVDIQFRLPTDTLVSAVQRGEMSKGNVVRELISVSDPQSDQERKITLNTLFGAHDQEKTLHSLNLYSYLTLARPESGEKVAAWLTQAKRGEIHTVAEDALTFFSEIFKNDHYQEINYALINDQLNKRENLPEITNVLMRLYSKIREVSPNHLTRELANLPVIETGIRLFMMRQINTLRDEISDAIKGRRNALRSSHQEPVGSEMSEEALREDEYPLLQNEPHSPVEINVAAGDHSNEEKLSHLLNGISQEGIFHYFKDSSHQELVDLLMYMGVELWSHTADSTTDFGAKSIDYIEERVGKRGIPERTYNIPQSKRGEYVGDFLLIPRSKTGMWFLVTQQPAIEHDDRFRMGYGDMIIGSLSGNKVSQLKN